MYGFELCEGDNVRCEKEGCVKLMGELMKGRKMLGYGEVKE